MEKKNMKAQMIRKNGGPEVFEATEVERPRAGAGQVLVEVAASKTALGRVVVRVAG